MKCPPRLALSTSGPAGAPGPEPAVTTLAILAGLAQEGWQVQHYRCRAVLERSDCIDLVTGRPGRHLDAWLMGPDESRATFLRGCDRGCDLALVEGRLSFLPGVGPVGRLGDAGLGPVVDAVQAPVVAVVPCRGLDGFHLPSFASLVDAFVLDGLERLDEFESVRRWIHLTTRKPVLGAIASLPEARTDLIRGLALGEVRFDSLDRLGASFRRFADLGAIRDLAISRPWPRMGRSSGPVCGACTTVSHRFRVAYAVDAAFGAYFPDTLELLESLGADLHEFSPLHDERLPEHIDLVVIGCGEPEVYADELAANVSLIADLKHHVCRGRQLYAEGGGCAYLARSLVLGTRRIPGAGILPIDAVLRTDPSPPEPVSATLVRESWIGAAGTTLRGYRNNRWRLNPAPDPSDCPARSGLLSAGRELVFRHNAIGSLLHLHPSSLPEARDAFAAGSGDGASGSGVRSAVPSRQPRHP
jgi:cobyrinic acid a,c-diamide synthase